MSTIIDLGRIAGIIRSSTPPTANDLLWYDTSANVVKAFNQGTSTWQSVLSSGPTGPTAAPTLEEVLTTTSGPNPNATGANSIDFGTNNNGLTWSGTALTGTSGYIGQVQEGSSNERLLISTVSPGGVVITNGDISQPVPKGMITVSNGISFSGPGAGVSLRYNLDNVANPVQTVSWTPNRVTELLDTNVEWVMARFGDILMSATKSGSNDRIELKNHSNKPIQVTPVTNSVLDCEGHSYVNMVSTTGGTLNIQGMDGNVGDGHHLFIINNSTVNTSIRFQHNQSVAGVHKFLNKNNNNQTITVGQGIHYIYSVAAGGWIHPK